MRKHSKIGDPFSRKALAGQGQPRRASRLKGKVRNVGIKPVRKTKNKK